MQRSKYWGQPLLLLTAGEIEPTLSSEKFERQTNFPAIKSSSAGKRSLLYRYCTSREIQNPNIQCYCLSILKKYRIENYTFLACPDNISIMIINRRMIRSWFYSDIRKSRRWSGSVVHFISYIWLNCYCWVKSNMVEGRFSKWF